MGKPWYDTSKLIHKYFWLLFIDPRIEWWSHLSSMFWQLRTLTFLIFFKQESLKMRIYSISQIGAPDQLFSILSKDGTESVLIHKCPHDLLTYCYIKRSQCHLLTAMENNGSVASITRMLKWFMLSLRCLFGLITKLQLYISFIFCKYILQGQIMGFLMCSLLTYAMAKIGYPRKGATVV